MKKQQYRSAKTSINSKKLPAIYNRLNWDTLNRYICPNDYGYRAVLDIGAGRFTDHIKEFVESKGWLYFPYDPWNQGSHVNTLSLRCHPTLVICSNVLNVIAEDDVKDAVHDMVKTFRCPYFITVYEGDKNNIPRVTHNGESYQRNALLDYYCDRDEITCKHTITKMNFIQFLK